MMWRGTIMQAVRRSRSSGLNSNSRSSREPRPDRTASVPSSSRLLSQRTGGSGVSVPPGMSRYKYAWAMLAKDTDRQNITDAIRQLPPRPDGVRC
jgi:hypothetical protein